MINARSETVSSKPAFRDSFKHRRCLIPADSFFEWAKLPNGQKQPMLVRLKDKSPMVFAGLWAHWDKDGTPIDSCTILTTDANDKLRSLHDRMPVILHPRSFSTWLDPDRTEGARLKGVMQPYESDELEVFPVSTRVNSPKNDVPAVVEPVATEAAPGEQGQLW
jgi:putative SOS response-associated peptidase YedK